MKPKFMPLSPAIGAEIEGVHITKPLDDEAFEAAAGRRPAQGGVAGINGPVI